MTIVDTLIPEQTQTRVKNTLQSLQEKDWENVGQTERIISAIGGALLLFFGLKSIKSISGIAMTVAGGVTLARGATGYCPVNDVIGRDSSVSTDPIEIKRSVTIGKPREEVYNFWRQLENLPRFMNHLEEVIQVTDTRSHWKARSPKDLKYIEWDAEITDEIKNERLSWRSVADSEVENAGEVSFKDAPGGRGTEVEAFIVYRVPGGVLGRAVAKILNPAFKQIVKEDLRNFQHLMETGELPVLEGQPSGRESENK